MKMLFLHGLGQQKQAWDKTIQHLKCNDIECPDLTFDLENNPTFDYMADKLELKIIEESSSIIICGLSLGAVLGLELYFRQPEKIAALILIAPQYKIPKMLIDVQNLFFRLMPNRLFLKSGLSKNNMISISSSIGSLDYSDRIKNISCPVYIVCGKKDKVNMKAAVRLNELLVLSSLKFVDGANHEVNIDKPDILAKIINSVYDEIFYKNLELQKSLDNSIKKLKNKN